MPVYQTYNCLNCNIKVTKANTKGKFCSLKCQHEYAYKNFIKNWLAGDLTNATRGTKFYPSKHIYRYFKENIKYCEICNIDKWMDKPIVLELDHINGDRTNPARNNLRNICPNCHSQTNTFRNKAR